MVAASTVGVVVLPVLLLWVSACYFYIEKLGMEFFRCSVLVYELLEYDTSISITLRVSVIWYVLGQSLGERLD